MMKKGFKMAIIGLGYVGMPLAIAFSKKLDVIGFDINEEKINKYISGIDETNEVGNEIRKGIKGSKIFYSCSTNTN